MIANSDVFTIFMTVITVYSLFGDDVRMALFTKSFDTMFDVMTIACLTLFVFEITIFSIVNEGYFMSFYFWLDLIASGSLVTDIALIMDTITDSQDYSASNAEQATNLARAGRGARLGTKAGRLTRVIRMVRLIRIVKLYKSA